MNKIEKLKEKLEKLERTDIYSNSEVIEFLVGIFEGKEGKIEEIEKKDERHYRIKFEDEWIELEHDFIIGFDFRSGRITSLRIKKISKRAGYIFMRFLDGGVVDVLLNKLKNIFESNIIRSTKISHDVTCNINKMLHSFHYLSKISGNVYIVKKDDKTYTLVRSSCYVDNTLAHKLEIYNGENKIKVFEGNSRVVNSLFKHLDFITEASAVELSEFDDLSKMMFDLES